MEFVEQLKSSLDIVKVVGEYVRLRPRGPGRFAGLCPFHQEKTPSFTVNQTRQIYKCFGCGAGGDLFKFVMEHDGLTFWEAVMLLAERNGIPLPRRTDYGDAESKLRGAVFEMHQIACDLFRASLRGPQGAEARTYLERRGVSAELVETFQLGFAEPSGQALARRLGESRFPAGALEASGLLRKRPEGGYYDSFRGRLMFPIHNESGKVIGFGGRSLREGDEPKYLNSPETPVYRKTSVLYNLHRARDAMRRAGRAVLVEGYMDVIGAYAAGVKEAVASCGTALTAAQVRAIHRHADAVIVNFDPDAAGASAAERAVQLFLDEGVHVRVLSLGGGEVKLDPDEFVKRFGAAAYLEKLESAPGYFHWLADRARARFDMNSAEGRTDAFKFLLPAVQKVNGRLERAAIAADLAAYLGVEAGLVLEQFKKAARDRGGPAPQPAAGPAIPPLERILLNAALDSDRVRTELLAAMDPALIATLQTREIFENLQHVQSGDPARLFAELEGRLGEAARELLHQAAAADDTGEGGSDPDLVWQQAEACVRRLEADHRKRKLAELRSRVKTAEREGRVEEALAWIAELHKLERDASGAHR
jgi:DNA primase